MKLRWLFVLLIFVWGCTSNTTSTSSPDATDARDRPAEQLAEDAVAPPSKESAFDTVPATKTDGAEELVVEEEPPVKPFVVGDEAPDIEVSQFVTGDPIDGLERGKLYIVEFWATWCGPCLRSMPHISELQEEYQNELTVIGVTREDEETVMAFLDKPSLQDPDKTWRDIVSYRLVLDQDDLTHAAYMDASGARGIPRAYIVGREGRLLWTGHPMGIDGPLKSIVAGEWNDSNAVAKSEEYEATLASLRDQINRSMVAQRNEQWDEALAILDSIENDETFREMVGDLKQPRLDLLLAAKRTDDFLALARQLEADMWNDPAQLNGMAWKMVTGDPEAEEILTESLKYAQRAVELTDESDPAILDTLARILFEQGQVDSAVDWQRKALELAPEGREDSYQQALDEYLIERAKLNDEADASDESEESPADDETEATEEAAAAT